MSSEHENMKSVLAFGVKTKPISHAKIRYEDNGRGFHLFSFERVVLKVLFKKLITEK